MLVRRKYFVIHQSCRGSLLLLTSNIKVRLVLEGELKTLL